MHGKHGDEYMPTHIICLIWTLHPGIFLRRSPILGRPHHRASSVWPSPQCLQNFMQRQVMGREEEKKQTWEQTFLTFLLSRIFSHVFWSLGSLRWFLTLPKHSLLHFTHICPFLKQLILWNTFLDPPLVFLQFDYKQITWPYESTKVPPLLSRLKRVSSLSKYIIHWGDFRNSGVILRWKSCLFSSTI